MFACPRDNGANALQMRFREGTWSLGPDANHAFTDGALYRQWASQCKGASDGERLSVAAVAQFSFRMGSCNAVAAPHLNSAALADGRRSVLSQREKKSYEISSLAEARTLGRGAWRGRSGHS